MQLNFYIYRPMPNVVENLDLGPSQSPGIGRSNLAPISNRGDDSIAPIAGAFASGPNQIFSHVRYSCQYFPLCSGCSYQGDVSSPPLFEAIRNFFQSAAPHIPIVLTTAEVTGWR